MTTNFSYTRTDYPTLVELAVWPGQQSAFQAFCSAAWGLSVPSANRSCAASNGAVLASVGPGKYWLLNAGPEVAASVGPAVASVVDLSSARTCFRLSGAGAQKLLAKGTSVDLRADPALSAGDGQVWLTGIAHIAVALHRPAGDEGKGSYHLYCYASLGEAMEAWIVNASRAL